LIIGNWDEGRREREEGRRKREEEARTKKILCVSS
jgi:hypothetical protein